jgi:hypothetical protein
MRKLLTIPWTLSILIQEYTLIKNDIQKDNEISNNREERKPSRVLYIPYAIANPKAAHELVAIVLRTTELTNAFA